MLGIVAVKAAFFAYGWLSYLTPWQGSVRSFHELIETWNRWDSLNYVWLAEHGYTAVGEKAHLIVYYPLYPALMRLLAPLAGGALGAALLVSSLASVAAGLSFHRLVRLDHDERDADRAVWFLFVFPASWALHVGYTESLFFALLFGCLLTARRERWGWAGVLGALCGLCRVNAVALLPTLALEAFAQWRQARRWRWAWLYAAGPAVGLAAYVLVNWRVTGDPFAFVFQERLYFKRGFAWPWQGLWHMWLLIFTQRASDAFAMRLQEFLFACLGVAGALAAWRQRPSYAVWALANLALFLSFDAPWSVPRYVLTLFPVFVFFARLGRRPVWFAALSAWSLLLLALMTSLFVRGFWAS